MPRNEEGEFELVVGNRQLLTIVFILMVLFGIVFSMGYFVGRNSVSETASTSGPARSPTAESASPAQPGSPPALPDATRETPPVDPGLERGQAKVAATSSKPLSAPEAEQAKPPETPQAAPPVAQKPKQSTPPAPPPAPEPAAGEESPAAQPAPGQTFLQVAAVRRPEAELMVDVLKRRGFSARVAPVPDKPEFRVLVGPLQDSAALAKTQADLQLAGFRSIVRKY